MGFIEFLGLLILVITILTMFFGVIAYFLYKVRERKSKISVEVKYEDVLKEEEKEKEKKDGVLVFFTKGK